MRNFSCYGVSKQRTVKQAILKLWIRRRHSYRECLSGSDTCPMFSLSFLFLQSSRQEHQCPSLSPGLCSWQPSLVSHFQQPVDLRAQHLHFSFFSFPFSKAQVLFRASYCHHLLPLPLFASRNSTCFLITGSYFIMLNGLDVRGRIMVRK